MRKSIVMVLALTMMLGTVAFAGETPAEIYSDIKGVDVQTLTHERGHGWSNELEGDELEEFKTRLYESKEEWIKSLVEDGDLSQDDADAYLLKLKEGVEDCDGTSRHLGQALNVGAGKGFGSSNGQRLGNGDGTHVGHGNGSNGRGYRVTK